MISSICDHFSKLENKLSEDMTNLYVEENIEYLNHFNIESGQEINWKRPIEVVDDPCLLEKYENEIDGYLISGLHTTKWFPAMVTLLKTKDLLHLVIENIQNQDNYNKSSYNGCFEFSFYENNVWSKIKIDDRLPFIVDEKKSLICTSSNKEEFLPPLLEKAYAKFLGGYSKLQSIDFLEGLMHFTGGIIETIELRRNLIQLNYQEQKLLFKKLKSLSTDVKVLCCTIENKNDKIDIEENRVQYLLSSNHFYLLTGLVTIPYQCNLNMINTLFTAMLDKPNRENIMMLRLHNPVLSGDWNGPFSVGSKEWESIHENVRRHCNLKFSHEFEFWMSMEDFCKNLERVILCHIPCCNFIESVLKQKGMWYDTYFHGKYSYVIPGVSPQNLSSDFLKNDQYFLEIANEDKVNVKIVVSFNCFDKLVRFDDGCGIILLKVENNRFYKIHDPDNSEVIKFKQLSENGNSASISTTLVEGKYVLLPWRSGVKEVEYYIRIYMSNKCINFSTLLQEDKPPRVHCLKCNFLNTFMKSKFIFPNPNRSISNTKCSSCDDINPESALRMTVVSVQDIEANEDKSHRNTYFILKTSDFTYKSVTKSLTNNPIWNESFIFYKNRKQSIDILFEVFAKKMFGFDKSMGIHEFKDLETRRGEMTVSLRIPENKEWIQTSAKVTVKFKTYTLSEFDSF